MPSYSYNFTDLVKKSYEYIQTLQFEKDEEKKYRLKSRGKVRNLANALKEFDKASDAIPQFVKYSEESLTHGAAAVTFESFFKKISDPSDIDGVQRTINSTLSSYTPDVKRKKILYLLRYTNWGAEGICSIFSAYPDDDNKVKEKLRLMVSAEFAVTSRPNQDSDQKYEKELVNNLFNLKASADKKYSQERENHV